MSPVKLFIDFNVFTSVFIWWIFDNGLSKLKNGFCKFYPKN